MGISGLLKALGPVLARDTICALPKGTVVAIDGSSWLHRSLYSCAIDLTAKKPTHKWLRFFRSQLDVLLRCGLVPFVVLDGERPGAKRKEDEKRSSRRDAARGDAEQALRDVERLKTALKGAGASGVRRRMLEEELEKTLRRAEEFCQKCVSPTPEMVRELLQKLREWGIRHVVAPFEADAQLAYLCKSKIAHAIITEDSDIPLFLSLAGACASVYFKMQSSGEAMRLDVAPGGPKNWPCFRLSSSSSPIPKKHTLPSGIGSGHVSVQPHISWDEPIGYTLQGHGCAKTPSFVGSGSAVLSEMAHMDVDAFLNFCVFSGCDYVESLPGVGIVTAAKFVGRRLRTDAHHRARFLLAEVQHKPNKKASCPDDYLAQVRQAETCFRHHLVLDITHKKKVHLTPQKDAPPLTASPPKDEHTQQNHERQPPKKPITPKGPLSRMILAMHSASFSAGDKRPNLETQTPISKRSKSESTPTIRVKSKTTAISVEKRILKF